MLFKEIADRLWAGYAEEKSTIFTSLVDLPPVAGPYRRYCSSDIDGVIGSHPY